MEATKFNVGDIVKLNRDGQEIVGIVYENGTGLSTDHRVQSPDGTKYRHLEPTELTPATEADLAAAKEAATIAVPAEAKAKLDAIIADHQERLAERMAAINQFTPDFIIQREASEHGATPVLDDDDDDDDNDD